MNMSKRAPFLISICDQVINSGTNLIASILIARTLGVEGFGEFSLYLMVMYLVLGMKNSLVNAPLMYDIGRVNRCGLKIAEEYVVFEILTSVIFTVALLLLYCILVRIGLDVAFSSVLLPMLYSYGEFCRKVIYSVKKDLYAPLLSFLKSFSLLLGLFYLVDGSGVISVEDVLVVYFYSAVVLFLGSFLVINSIGIKQRFLLSKFLKIWKQTKDFSVWLFYGSILSFFREHFISVFSGVMLGSGVVGGIRSAQTILGIFQTFYMALENVLPVRASEKKIKEGSLMTVIFLIKIYFIIILLFFPFFILMFFKSEEILVFVYGESYGSYGYFVKFFIFIYLSYFTAYMISIFLRAEGFTKVIFIGGVASSIFSVFGAYPFMYIWGGVGAIAAICIAPILGIAVNLFCLRLLYSKE